VRAETGVRPGPGIATSVDVLALLSPAARALARGRAALTAAASGRGWACSACWSSGGGGERAVARSCRAWQAERTTLSWRVQLRTREAYLLALDCCTPRLRMQHAAKSRCAEICTIKRSENIFKMLRTGTAPALPSLVSARFGDPGSDAAAHFHCSNAAMLRIDSAHSESF
jgi:hypothetical protein